MKTALLVLTFALGVFSILDRSYYDALCTIDLIQNCLSAQTNKKSEMLSANYPKSITRTETLARGKDLKRSMWVNQVLFSI